MVKMNRRLSMAKIRARALMVLGFSCVALTFPVVRAPAAPKAAAGKAGAAGNAEAAKAGPLEATRPRFVIKAEKGFIDDSFAIDPEAGRLAVLLTDSASFARIDLIDLQTGKPSKTIEIGDPQRLFERIVLVPGGKGVVLISRDTRSNKRGAQYFDAAGAPAASVGPYDDFGLATRSGETLLVAWQKASDNAGDTGYTVAAHRLAGLAHVGKPTAFTVTKAHALAQPPLEDVEWQDGYAQLLGLRRGEADKKTGAVHDHAVVLDALSGAVTWEGELGDKTVFDAVRELRRKTPGRSAFLMFSPDTHVLELLDFLGRHAPVAPPVPLSSYDATTLVDEQDFATGAVIFSLASQRDATPSAVGRKPMTPSFLDLYRLDPHAAKPGAASGREPLRFNTTHVLRTTADDRPVAWEVRGKYVALLRRVKDYSRGGAQLELYAVDKTP
jgi:hypothetical protein